MESWDGKLTYGEVEKLSTQLAVTLLSLGLELDIVPLCFEKSMWTIVAVLGAIKVGAAFALMDPSQPIPRLRSIVSQVNARIILTSSAQQNLASKLSENARIISVGPASPKPDFGVVLPVVPVSSKLYIQFTSGSTGQPKGVIISHSQYTSGALPRSTIVGYEESSRVLDFASYAFDVSIDCMLCTLACGGCICVPSDEARVNDLAGSIKSMKVNMAHMTPSVARVLDPKLISSLSVMGLGGETVTAGDAATWSRLTRIIIAYGPSECTVGCTVNGNVVATNQNPTIGKGVGAVMWIVDPSDHEHLLPIGAVGELLVEGPIVGDGYLHNPEKTAEVFIETPKWLQAGSRAVVGRTGRLYKTGDLVKYDRDGSIIFQGRKDTQVKLRGQRIELSEVEHHLRLNLPDWIELSAEVIVSNVNGAKPTLVAFMTGKPVAGTDVDMSSSQSTTHPLVLSCMPEVLANCLDGLEKRLSETAPIYMIPSAYIPISKMPMMVSGKLDRKELKAAVSEMSPRELTSLRSKGKETCAPKSENGLRLQKLWSQLLCIDKSSISTDDNFFALGGDSIMVMRMVSAARREGILLRAHEVLANPVLSDMASLVTVITEKSNTIIPPFSLLPDNRKRSLISDVSKTCNIQNSMVEDTYPCTPLQEALMALSAKRTEAYVAQRVVQLPDRAAVLKLQEAWEKVAEACAILRTRIVYAKNMGLLQVVSKEEITWRTSSNLEDYMEQDRDEPMYLGSQLARYAIVNDNLTSNWYFVWTIHHSLYDGWSMGLLMERVRKTYLGQDLPSPAPFKTFIKYLNDQDHTTSQNFWRSKLQGANVPQFPALPYVGYEPKADSLLERKIRMIRGTNSSNTPSTVIRAAWTLLCAQLIGSDDVVFGETLMGRNAPITGAEELEGPMITTVPVRTQLDRNSSVLELLKSIHEDSISRIHHEHLGLQHIRRLSPDAQIASDLHTGLVIQPGQIDNPVGEDFGDDLPGLAPKSDLEAAKEALHFNSYALMLVCSLELESFLVMASFDSNVVDMPLMSGILERFDAMVQKILESECSIVGEILTSGSASDFQPLPNNSVKVLETFEKSKHNSDTPLTETEQKLQQLWGDTIGIPIGEITTTDNFFSLGGDSITAMKLVAAVRSEGLTMSVADVFRQPKLNDQAKLLLPSQAVAKMEEAEQLPSKSKNGSFSLLDLQSIFLTEVVKPKLQDPTWKIKDVFPTTNDQDASIKGTITAPRFSIQYNLMFLDQIVDRERLLESWQQLIARHEILRTIFVEIGGQMMHVILEELVLPVNEYETSENIDDFARHLCAYDSNTTMLLGSAFLKLFFIKSTSSDSQNCLAIRMSHSQYDGMSLPNLFLEVQTLYSGGKLLPCPGFSSYIYHMNQPAHLAHWRRQLEGSKLSILGTYKNQADVSPAATFLTTTVDISSRPKEITTATFLSAGWAIVLAQHLQVRDVTFGHIVSGRSIDVFNAEQIMGMCDNHLPIRVQFPTGIKVLELLQSIQTQRAINAPYEATQFHDIVLYSTDWTEEQKTLRTGSSVGFDSMVHHQDIEYFDTINLGNTTCRLDVWNPDGEPAMEWKVQSSLREGKWLDVEIMCSESFKELAEVLIVKLKGAISMMIERPEGLVFEH